MTIVFRCDAGEEIGIGHVMRCFALCEEVMARGHEVCFAAATLGDGLRGRLADAGVRIAHIGDGYEDLLALLFALGAGACVLDGYHLDTEYRAAVQQSGVRVLAFDDTASLDALHADIVVNASAHGHDLPYARIAAGAALLIGPDYVLLRAEFRRRMAAGLPPLAERRRLLVSFGGSDPAGLTAPVLSALAAAGLNCDGIDVVAGAAHPGLADLTLRARSWPDLVRLHVDSQQMAELMADAGLAISAGGGTIAELAALAVPTLLVVVADNQAAAAAQSWCEVVSSNIGAGRIVAEAVALWREPERRSAIAVAAHGVVDGRGAERICDMLLRDLEEAVDGG